MYIKIIIACILHHYSCILLLLNITYSDVYISSIYSITQLNKAYAYITSTTTITCAIPYYTLLVKYVPYIYTLLEYTTSNVYRAHSMCSRSVLPPFQGTLPTLMGRRCRRSISHGRGRRNGTLGQPTYNAHVLYLLETLATYTKLVQPVSIYAVAH